MSAGVENTIAALWSAQGIVNVDVSVADQTLAAACRGVMVGGSGDVAVVMADGSSGTLPGLMPGTLYPVAVKTFKKSGTVASNIKALI